MSAPLSDATIDALLDVEGHMQIVESLLPKGRAALVDTYGTSADAIVRALATLAVLGAEAADLADACRRLEMTE